MAGDRPVTWRRRAVLPVLALLFAAAVGSVVYMLFEYQELQATCDQSEIVQRTASTKMRARVARARQRRRGELVAAPKTPGEVRAMVAFCDTATSADVSDLRRVALSGEDTLAAANAVRALGRLRAVASDPKLAALVRDPRVRVRDEAILALGESGVDAVTETLEALTTDPDANVRLLALRALGRLGGERAKAVLRDVRESPSATREERAFAQLDPARVPR